MTGSNFFCELEVLEGADLTALDYHLFDHFLLQAYGKKAEDFQVDKERLLSNLRFAKDSRATLAGLSGVPRMIKLVREKVGREPDIVVEQHEGIVRIPRP